MSTSAARRSAGERTPVVTTDAAVRDAIAATRGSSALRIAIPPAAADGSASTNSPLATAMFSALPNSPMWADPTFSTTPIRGGAVAASAAMCPMPRAESSSTRNRVSEFARKTV